VFQVHAASARVMIPVSADILSAMLLPYLTDVHYLRSAVVEVLSSESAMDHSGDLVVGR
jgi:hypothetical protein